MTSGFVSAFVVAERMLGALPLSAGQMAQLRAIDRKYQQRLFTLLHDEVAEDDATGSSSQPAPARTPSDEEMAALEVMIRSDILDLLTRDQLRVLRRE